MRGQLFKLWDRVRSSFWFIPVIMAAMAVTLAFASITVDQPLTQWLQLKMGWTFTGEAEGASAVLGIIASSMITIAGVVFSMTLVALSLASSQLGPRLLRSFMRDTTTQVVLGTFIATFLYCLIVMRSIRRVDEVAFVPHLSVTLGVLLAVGSLGVFIYFIHHVSVSIQANEMAARIGRELIAGIERLLPPQREAGVPQLPINTPSTRIVEAFEHDAQPIAAAGDGYLQFIDKEALIALAIEHDLVVKLELQPGNYVVDRCPLALVSPASQVNAQLTEQINACFVLGNHRTSDQDIQFGAYQLVEIAVRALSPGLNDPFTAITCIDHLGSALCRLVARDIPSPYHYDPHDQLRLIAPAVTFSEIIDTAFNQIRQNSRTSAAVTLRLLQTIAVTLEFVHRTEDRATLLQHAEMIFRGANEGLPEQQDRLSVEARYQTIRKNCSQPT